MDRENPLGLDVSSILTGLFRRPGPLVIYFPPGHYSLGPAPDGSIHYVCRESVQLFFAANALLQLAKSITLEIKGTLRAGAYQIFGRSRYQRQSFGQREGAVGLPITWPMGQDAGRVLITSRRMSSVRPEWWGALAKPERGQLGGVAEVPTGFDSSESLQAAIDTASVGRVGLPPLTVMLGGMYQCNRTLEVRAPADPDGPGYLPVSLRMRGNQGLGAAGRGVPSILRTRNNEIEHDDALLPRVIEKHRVLLRLHPGVDFDFEDLRLSVADDRAAEEGGVESCVEVLCDAFERSGRRGVMRRVALDGSARHQLKIVEDGRAALDERKYPPIRRHFVLDSCSLSGEAHALGDRELQVEAGEGVMVHVSNSAVYTPRVERTVLDLGSDASLCMAGASLLIEAMQFHRATGPRPSTRRAGSDLPDLDVPDGHDVYLDRPAGERAGTHFTAVQCESQSWWFLGRNALAKRAHNAVMVGVSHYNANWQYDEHGVGFFYDTDDKSGLNPEASRYVDWNVEWGRWDIVPRNVLVDDRPESPPSVVWCGQFGQCVLIGCRLGVSLVTDRPESITDVATVFALFVYDQRRKIYLAPNQMLRRPRYRYDLEGVPTFDGAVLHLVPIVSDEPPV